MDDIRNYISDIAFAKCYLRHEGVNIGEIDQNIDEELSKYNKEFSLIASHEIPKQASDLINKLPHDVNDEVEEYRTVLSLLVLCLAAELQKIKKDGDEPNDLLIWAKDEIEKEYDKIKELSKDELDECYEKKKKEENDNEIKKIYKDIEIDLMYLAYGKRLLQIEGVTSKKANKQIEYFTEKYEKILKPLSAEEKERKCAQMLDALQDEIGNKVKEYKEYVETTINIDFLYKMHLQPFVLMLVSDKFKLIERGENEKTINNWINEHFNELQNTAKTKNLNDVAAFFSRMFL